MRYSCSRLVYSIHCRSVWVLSISSVCIPGPVVCVWIIFFGFSSTWVCARTLMIWICKRPWYSVYCSSYNFIHLYLTALLAIQAQIHSIMCACMQGDHIHHSRRWHCQSHTNVYTILITKTTSSNFSFVARIYLQKINKRNSECEIMNEVLAVRLQHVSVSMYIMFTHKVKQKLYCAPYLFVGSL